jgi:hypothetical protein
MFSPHGSEYAAADDADSTNSKRASGGLVIAILSRVCHKR